MFKWKLGQKVEIYGDEKDSTEELNGMIGRIVGITNIGCAVKVPGYSNGHNVWFILNENMEVVENA